MTDKITSRHPIPPRGIARSRRGRAEHAFHPSGPRGGSQPKVSTFRWYFERMCVEHVYRLSPKRRALPFQSIEQPEGAQLLFQLAAANKAARRRWICAAWVDRCAARPVESIWRNFDLSATSPTSPSFREFREKTRFRQCRRHVLVHDVRGQPGGAEAPADSWTVLWDKHRTRGASSLAVPRRYSKSRHRSISAVSIS